MLPSINLQTEDLDKLLSEPNFQKARLHAKPELFHHYNQGLCSPFDLSHAELHRRHVRGRKAEGNKLCPMKKKILLSDCPSLPDT